MTMEGNVNKNLAKPGNGNCMNHWERDEIGLKKDIQAHLSSSLSSASSHTTNLQLFGYIWCTTETRLQCSVQVVPVLHAGPNFQTRPDPTRRPIHNGKSCKTNNELNVYQLLCFNAIASLFSRHRFSTSLVSR